MPSDGDRARFGLPTDAPLFLCSQSLFKIHPDNDAMLARVLEAAPRAQLVIFAGRDPSLTARMAARFARAGIATERLRVLAQCSHDDFLRINRLGDAMLDTLQLFGMGFSWGGFESLAIPFDCSAYRTATHWNPGGPTLRLHIGLESTDDLKADLDRGFAAFKAAL